MGGNEHSRSRRGSRVLGAGGGPHLHPALRAPTLAALDHHLAADLGAGARVAPAGERGMRADVRPASNATGQHQRSAALLAGNAASQPGPPRALHASRSGRGSSPLVAGVHAAAELLAARLAAGRHHCVAGGVVQALLAAGAGLGAGQGAGAAEAGVAHQLAAVAPAVQRLAAHAAALRIVGGWGVGVGVGGGGWGVGGGMRQRRSACWVKGTG